jgi:uncharacterized DUF497 family protein
MEITFDDTKNKINIEKHKVSFELVAKFDFKTAMVMTDNRKDYGEIRQVAYGFIDTRLFVLCFVVRSNKFRIISLRKANKREIKNYENINK